MRKRSIVLIGVAASAIAAIGTASAQDLPAPQDSPPPQLDSKADPHDWAAYYNYGVDVIRRSFVKADGAFYWAERMDPRRAEPKFGRWVTFWLSDISEYEDYVFESPSFLRDPKFKIQSDLLDSAYARNPFVNKALEMLLIEHYLHRGEGDAYIDGWVSYARGFYPQATGYFQTAVRNVPKGGAERQWRLFDLTLVYVQQRMYDSATSTLNELLTLVRKQDNKDIVYYYNSKEKLEYGLGLVYAEKGQLLEARQAQERALQENLAYAPAHAALGQLATARRDFEGAAVEYGLAVELRPYDGAMRYWYGASLLRAQKPVEAVDQLKQAIKLEPYFAESYYLLGLGYQAESDTTSALAAYSDFLKKTPRSAKAMIAAAKTSITALGGQSPP